MERFATTETENSEGVTMEVVFAYTVNHGEVTVQRVHEITAGWLEQFHGAELKAGDWMKSEAARLHDRLFTDDHWMTKAETVCLADYEGSLEDTKVRMAICA